MSDLDQILETYGRKSARADDSDLQGVTVKIPTAVREEFWEASKTVGVPRRELAAALFMHGMERLRRQIKPPMTATEPSPPSAPPIAADTGAHASTPSAAAPHASVV